MRMERMVERSLQDIGWVGHQDTQKATIQRTQILHDRNPRSYRFPYPPYLCNLP